MAKKPRFVSVKVPAPEPMLATFDHYDKHSYSVRQITRFEVCHLHAGGRWISYSPNVICTVDNKDLAERIAKALADSHIK